MGAQRGAVLRFPEVCRHYWCRGLLKPWCHSSLKVVHRFLVGRHLVSFTPGLVICMASFTHGLVKNSDPRSSAALGKNLSLLYLCSYLTNFPASIFSCCSGKLPCRSYFPCSPTIVLWVLIYLLFLFRILVHQVVVCDSSPGDPFFCVQTSVLSLAGIPTACVHLTTQK